MFCCVGERTSTGSLVIPITEEEKSKTVRTREYRVDRSTRTSYSSNESLFSEPVPRRQIILRRMTCAFFSKSRINMGLSLYWLLLEEFESFPSDFHCFPAHPKTILPTFFLCPCPLLFRFTVRDLKQAQAILLRMIDTSYSTHCVRDPERSEKYRCQILGLSMRTKNENAALALVRIKYPCSCKNRLKVSPRECFLYRKYSGAHRLEGMF